jgi:hypothetical protein
MSLPCFTRYLRQYLFSTHSVMILDFYAYPHSKATFVTVCHRTALSVYFSMSYV